MPSPSSLSLPVVTPSALAAPRIAPVPSDGPLLDAQGRRITYLRLSVTDRCNFRCTYCSPSHWAGREDFLSADELVRLASVFSALGIERVRLTGGEPLLRSDLTEIAGRVAQLPGVREVCLTTNGHRLAELALPLRKAGVRVVNVSLDTLDSEAFRAVTKKGDVARVMRGVEAAASAGFTRLGVNAVVMGGVNDSAEQLAELVRFSWRLGAVPRFIELMPFAGSGEVVPAQVVLDRLESQGIALQHTGGRAGAGPADYARGHDSLTGLEGEVGVIGAMTENFCSSCNRVRMTATGEVRACLGGRDQVPLAPMLRAGASDEELSRAIRSALLAKWDGHRFNADGSRGLLSMMGIGG